MDGPLLFPFTIYSSFTFQRSSSKISLLIQQNSKKLKNEGYLKHCYTQLKSIKKLHQAELSGKLREW